MPPTSETFLSYAKAVRVEIDDALKRYLAPVDGCPEVLRQAMRHSLLAPGKRLRPLLVLMAAEACGCSQEAAMPAACAVEMVHTYSLIHDDLPAMDDDEMRRGLPSCHARFGVATAILAGDALLTYAFEVLARQMRPAATAARCCVELAQAAGAAGMVGGQQDDLSAERSDGDLEHLESIHARKTGPLFLSSLRMGGVVGGASEVELQALDTYGAKLGLAFQIVDDLLDQEGSTGALGKHAGKDLARGKLTFPGLLGVEESQRRAEQLVREASQALSCFADRASRLEALAVYVLERKR